MRVVGSGGFGDESLEMKRKLVLCFLLSLLGGWAWSQERAAKPAFKGMELYSWSSGKEWRYALLPGTNRLKTWQEIQSAGVDEKQLRARMTKLAIGEYVSWLNFDPHLRYPPNEVRTSLEKLAEVLKLQMFVAR